MTEFFEGNLKLKDTISDLISSRTLPHAIILEGPVGIGKRTAARYIAAALNCEKKGAKPCLECRRCKNIMSDRHADVMFFGGDPKSRGFKIEEIRRLKASLSVTPVESDCKIYILVNAENMGVEAANALLISIEEPNPGTFFILTADNVKNLLPTITSRCSTLKLELLKKSDVEARLIALGHTADAAKKAAAATGGNFGAALDFIKGDSKKNVETAAELIGALKKSDFFTFCSLLSKYESDREGAYFLLLAFADALEDLLKLKIDDSAPIKNELFRAEFSDAAQSFSAKFITGAMLYVTGAADKTRQNANTALCLNLLAAELICA